MTCITIAQTTRLQVEYTHPQGDEHTVVVALADILVHGLDDTTWQIGMGSDVAEERAADSHHQ